MGSVKYEIDKSLLINLDGANISTFLFVEISSLFFRFLAISIPFLVIATIAISCLIQSIYPYR